MPSPDFNLRSKIDFKKPNVAPPSKPAQALSFDVGSAVDEGVKLAARLYDADEDASKAET